MVAFKGGADHRSDDVIWLGKIAIYDRKSFTSTDKKCFVQVFDHQVQGSASDAPLAALEARVQRKEHSLKIAVCYAFQFKSSSRPNTSHEHCLMIRLTFTNCRRGCSGEIEEVSRGMDDWSVRSIPTPLLPESEPLYSA